MEVLATKNRIQKAQEYDEKYAGIPRDYNERLAYLYDKLRLNQTLNEEILAKRDAMLDTLYYEELKIVLYEDPEGAPRPRFRLINRQNFANAALSNPSFVHVYSITGAQDQRFMKRLVTENDFFGIEHLIYTPCDILIDTFKATPKYFSKADIILSEIGLINPITKPDWDNYGKKYSDMFNSNVWLDDNLVILGTVRKFYSVLPRVEIYLRYLNMLYNKQQAMAVEKSIDDPSINIAYFGKNKGEFL